MTNALMWKYGWPVVEIVYMTWPGKFVWIFINDRGSNQGMYCVRTIGLDGIE
jgi:hypothetical protein